jgi:hypothetical protein
MDMEQTTVSGRKLSSLDWKAKNHVGKHPQKNSEPPLLNLSEQCAMFV